MPYTQSRLRADITLRPKDGSAPGIDLGVADNWSGGEKTSDATNYRRAGGTQILGANPTRNDGKATYLFDNTFASNYRQLDTWVGRGDIVATIQLTMVADDDTPIDGGALPPLTGILKTLPPPPGDPKSDDPDEIDLEFTLNTELS